MEIEKYGQPDRYYLHEHSLVVTIFNIYSFRIENFVLDCERATVETVSEIDRRAYTFDKVCYSCCSNLIAPQLTPVVVFVKLFGIESTQEQVRGINSKHLHPFESFLIFI